MRRKLEKRTGLPRARVNDEVRVECGGCFQRITGPMLEVPVYASPDASVICMPCLEEALEEHRRAGVE